MPTKDDKKRGQKSITFSPGEIETTRRVMRKVRKMGGFWPDALWPDAYATDSKWATELVIIRRIGGVPWILLTVYRDKIKKFRGKWHIPGGHGKVGDGSFRDACWRIAHREIDEGINILGVIGLPYFWEEGEHPYGRPLSIFTRCHMNTDPVVGKDLRWFQLTELPANMVGVHRRFINENMEEIISV